MDKQKFFDEVTRKLSELDCDARQERGALAVWYKVIHVGWIDHGGEAVFNMATNQDDNGKLYRQGSELAGDVRMCRLWRRSPCCKRRD